MKRLMPTIVLLLLASLLPIGISAHMAPTPLKAQVGKKRPLLIFTPTPNDFRAIQQMNLISGTPKQLSQVRERDIFLYLLPVEMPEDGDLSRADANAARARFHISASEFTVILLGKDGEEKLRSHEVVSIDRLNRLIDSMPMRQQEMKGHSDR